MLNYHFHSNGCSILFLFLSTFNILLLFLGVWGHSWLHSKNTPLAKPYGICRIVLHLAGLHPCLLIKEKDIWKNTKFLTHTQYTMCHPMWMFLCTVVFWLRVHFLAHVPTYLCCNYYRRDLCIVKSDVENVKYYVANVNIYVIVVIRIEQVTVVTVTLKE